MKMAFYLANSKKLRGFVIILANTEEHRIYQKINHKKIILHISKMFCGYFGFPEIKTPQSKIILRIPYEMVKISGNFIAITP